MVMDAAKGALEDVSTIMGKLTKSTGELMRDHRNYALVHIDRNNPHIWSSNLQSAAGKAAWIAGTAFLILVVPLIIEMDREQQLVDFEGQQLNALTGPSGTASASK